MNLDRLTEPNPVDEHDLYQMEIDCELETVANWYNKLSKLENKEERLGIKLDILLDILMNGCWARAEYEEPKFYAPSMIRIRRLNERDANDDFYIFFTQGIEVKTSYECDVRTLNTKQNYVHATENCICFKLSSYGLSNDNEDRYEVSGFALTREELE